MHSLKSEYVKSQKKKKSLILCSFSKKNKNSFEPLFYANWEAVEQFLKLLYFLLAESNGKSFY